MSSDRMPPGQVETRKLPIVGERQAAPHDLDLDRWPLALVGEVEEELHLVGRDLVALGPRERQVDIHCVTGWTRLGTTFTGIPLADLLDRARPSAAARFVRFVSSSPRGHDTSLPLAVARDDTWLVWERDGAALEPEHGYPLRTLTPSRYFYKSLKWVQRIELLVEDRLGYWERESAYHNVGDPWPGDQRFTTGSLDPVQVERFRSARSYVPWRVPQRALIGVDLRGWSPVTLEIGAVSLKGCDLRGARLHGADLAGANLSLSDLRGADLRDADLRGADLEGVRFAGADLTGADLRDSLLTATRFDGPGEAPARTREVRWSGASGLLDGQARFLPG